MLTEPRGELSNQRRRGGPSDEDVPQQGSRTARHRYEAADGTYLVCPLCFNAKGLDASDLPSNAEVGGTVPFWEWIGDGATTFSF